MGGNTKAMTMIRRASSLSKVSTPPSTTRSTKTPKISKVIQLKLPSPLLQRFPHEIAPSKSVQPKSCQAPTPALPASNEKAKSAPADTDSKSTPASSPSEPPDVPSDNAKSKISSGPNNGIKRELGDGVDDASKFRGRPGPRKRQKLDNGTFDGNAGKSSATNAPPHKLGPKANQGAINAGLRALDRTGTPCRKWKKTGFGVKTFTGVTWQIPAWRAPKVKEIETDRDPGETSFPASNCQSKENNSSSNIGSDKSRSVANDSRHMASSPCLTATISA